MSAYSSRHRRKAYAAAALLLLPLVVALFAFARPASASAAGGLSRQESCLGPVAHHYVYDCAHLLTPAEIADLEAQAAAVVRAGAPTVVYLQVRDATAEQTLQDAIDLMNRWNVESHPGAHDGFVMFFNLQPGNLRHGQVALYAGEKHYLHGNLPAAELERIRTDVMTPLLENGQTAAGIAAGLQMVAHDLRYGPPPPPASQIVAADIGRVPFNALAVLFAGAVALLVFRLTRQPPLSSARDEVGGREAVARPGDLPPAMAGALLKGRITDAQIEATILDFARRGMLVFEPVGDEQVRIRLVSTESERLTRYEQMVWHDLLALAQGKRGVISSRKLRQLSAGWGAVKAELRRELIERGWYDPAAAAARRRPLYRLGTLGVVGIGVALVLVALSHESWAMIGLLLFLCGSWVAFVRGHRVMDMTVEGEIAAAPWRGYRASVESLSYEPNLDADLPYIVALGMLPVLSPRLKAASERGYSPSWFHAQAGKPHEAQPVGFYPYWLAFHVGTMPGSSPTGGGGYAGGGSFSGGFSGGGAAGGGGGTTGGFY